jgi:hypothetical protein
MIVSMHVELSSSSLWTIPKFRDTKTLDARRVANAGARMAIGHVNLLVDGHLRHKIASSGIGILP